MAGLTVEYVRDRIVKCFLEAHWQTTESIRTKLKLSVTKEAIEKSIILQIKDAFEKVQVNFDHPTKEGLVRVVERLKYKAQSVGRDREIIEKNVEQMMELISRIE